MNILGIDTTTKNASCTILTDDEFYTNNVVNEITHSEKLLPIIHETLSNTNLSLNNINLLAAINGPGSFTGIRIGLATIKAFAQVKDCNIYSISSIDLMAYVASEKYFKENNTDTVYVLSLIDARNGRVYYALNKVVKNKENKIEISKIIDVGNELVQDLSIDNISSPLVIAGDCVEKYREILSSKFTFVTLDEFYPTTKDLIQSYLHISDTDKYMYNAYTLDALYARPSQAERMAKKDE